MSPSVPKWRQIADELTALIADGTYSPGARLPHIAELVRQGMGSTATVHRAYQTLEAEGLVKTSRGHGTTVLDPSTQAAGTVSGAGRLERLRRTGKPYAPGEEAVNRKASVRSCGDAQVADALGIELFDEIVFRSRSFRRGDRVTSLGLNLIHIRMLSVVPELLDPAPMPKFRHELYEERTGKEVTRGPQLGFGRAPSENELSEFGIELPSDTVAHVMVVHTLFSDEDGPLELWEDIYRPGMKHPIG